MVIIHHCVTLIIVLIFLLCHQSIVSSARTPTTIKCFVHYYNHFKLLVSFLTAISNMRSRTTNTLLLWLFAVLALGVLVLSILYVTLGYTVYKVCVFINASCYILCTIVQTKLITYLYSMPLSLTLALPTARWIFTNGKRTSLTTQDSFNKWLIAIFIDRSLSQTLQLWPLSLHRA